MASDLALMMLKVDLGLKSPPEEVENFLVMKLNAAEAELHELYDISLDSDRIEDVQLQEMYAAWLYQKRVTGEPKSPMLRQTITDRQLAAARKGKAGL